MGTYLGLDVGGTRSRWTWSDTPEVHRRPGGIQAARGTSQAAAELARLLLEIQSQSPGRTPDFTGIGMAGAGDPAVAAEIEAELRKGGVSWPLAVVGDVVVAAGAALGAGPGLVLWSGTGSFSVARDVQGRLHRVGGRGYLIGDAGSAYDIVRSAGAAVVRAMDGMGPATDLTAVLCKSFGCSSPVQLGAAMQSRRPAGMASACPAIVAAARGDEVARGILRAGAAGLAAQAAAAGRMSGLDPASTDLFLGGGLLEVESLFKELLAEELSALGFEQPPRTVCGGAAVGGVALAEALHCRCAPMCHWVEPLGTP